MECSICNTAIKENYCPNCGQKAGREELSLFGLTNDLLTNLFSLERTWLSGIYWVATEPKKIISNYWAGNRGYYPSPGKMVFYGLTIAALHIGFVDENLLGIRLTSNREDPQFLFMLVIIPLMILSSWITFIRTDKSFVHHLIANLYAANTFFILITVIDDLGLRLIGLNTDDYLLVVFSLVTFFTNARVFSTKKMFLPKLLYTILQSALFFGMVAFLVLAISWVNKSLV